MVNDVANREYINESTVDFVIIFIANDGVYHFLLNENPKIIDVALEKKVILASPLNLYAILSIVRQASEHYVIEKSAKRILELLIKFKKEWETFIDEFNKISESIDKLKENFNKFTSTRKTKLDNILNDIEIETHSQNLIDDETKNIN